VRIEYLGNERILYGKIEGQTHAGECTARFSAHETAMPVREGELYPFTVSRGDLKHFDRQTGRRLPAN
jgi:multiple sugar transport system ATP-binding protein